VDATTQAVNALREIIDAEDSMQEALAHTAEGAQRAIADADAVTISVLHDGKPRHRRLYR
jgi:vacuolar-type H+-ATPase subunit H